MCQADFFVNLKLSRKNRTITKKRPYLNKKRLSYMISIVEAIFEQKGYKKFADGVFNTFIGSMPRL